MKRILEISTGIIHPPLRARRIVHRIITDQNCYEIKRISSIEGVRKLHEGSWDAVLIYLHRQKISSQAAGILDEFVRNGGGLLGLHSASASYKTCDQFYELLGGRFKFHGPVQDFSIVQDDASLFCQMDGVNITDELYYHTLKKDITVHFSTSDAEGVKIPLVWTRTHGTGLVCYSAPGHTVSSIENPLVQKIILKGIAWVSHNNT
jgi:type 1 glutamine amidotransferase